MSLYRGRPELHQVWGGQIFGGSLPIFTEESPTICIFLRLDPRLLQETGDLSPLRLTPLQPKPDFEVLRHILLGSRNGVQPTIHQLIATKATGASARRGSGDNPPPGQSHGLPGAIAGDRLNGKVQRRPLTASPVKVANLLLKCP